MPQETFLTNSVSQYQTAAEVTAECVQLLCSPENLDHSLAAVLRHLCGVLSARRTYLYQFCEGHWELLCEWYAEPSGSSVDAELWPCPHPTAWSGPRPLFLHGSLAPLREACPSFLGLLSFQGVSTAAVMPLEANGAVVGFLGADEPDPATFCVAGPLLRTLGCAVAAAQAWNDKEQELERLRLYDNLTGAFCREVYLQDLQAARSERSPLGIIRFQLIDQKRITERFGYAHGDALLIECVQHSALFFASWGKLYRVDYNEFAILCTSLDRDHFEELAIQWYLDLESTLHCGIAIGYQWTTQPRKAERLDLAAESMLDENRQHRLRMQLLAEQLPPPSEDSFGMLSLDGLTTLLAEERFTLYLQPKLSFSSGALMGAEALVRFVDSTGAIVEPGRFLSDLEAVLLIKYVDLYVFEHACRLIRGWLDKAPHKSTRISVNFSRVTLLEPNLVPQLLHLCRKYSVAPSCMELELAANTDHRSSEHFSKVVEHIRTAGFTVSVDDFGIRFANLSVLLALDCDKLKVDRSLIENLTTNPKAQSILHALAELCTATGIQTTVEGIETAEQLSLLKTMGFDEMQGYLISQPLSATDFREKYLF